MIGRTITALLVLAMAAAVALGQPADEGVASGADEESPPPQTSRPEDAPDAGEPADSPFDYRASEQISEDLSVSFPVDI